MNAKATACPPKNLLSDFGLGKLDDRAAETLSEHLETCDDCRRQVDRMEGDSFVQRMREAVGPQSPASPAESVSNAASSAEIPTTDGAGPAPPPQPADQSAASLSLPPALADSPDFEVIKVLGQGGMGIVYLARNRMMDRLEVLKVVSKSLLDRPGSAERFQQEIRAAARLLNPHIVAAHSVPRLGDLLVFAMEYVDGQNLAQVVKRRGPLPVVNATFYAHQVALGLQHAHEKGMVHRDIKPSNLMLAIENKKHVVKILDFGLAKATSEKAAAEDADADAGGLTKSGQLLGTPDYIAPEQTLDARNADIRADIYSLGCTLYYLLSGHPPFHGSSMYEILQAHHQTEALPLNRVRSDVPAELAAVVAKMMAKSPANRYQTPSEVAKALGPFFKAQAAAEAKGDLPPAAAQPAPAPQPAAAPLPVAVRLAPAGQAAAPASPAGLAAKPNPRRKQAGSGRRRRGPPIAIGLVVLGFIGAAAMIFKFKTADGIVVVKVNVANPDVLVDGNRMTVTWADGGKQAEINVPAGSHQIELKKDGFQAFGQTVSLADGGQELLTARLDPLPGPPTSTASGKREPAGSPPSPAIAPFDAKQARAHQEAWAKYLGVPVEQTNSIGMKLVLIPPGEFMMGSTPEQIEARKRIARQDGVKPPNNMLADSPEEMPQHRVTISKPFLSGATEVTIGQFRRFVEATEYVTETERQGGGFAWANWVEGKGVARTESITWRAPGYPVVDGSPVTQITWGDAIHFCNWLSEKENVRPCYPKDARDGLEPLPGGIGYRLPSEAEWEFACRAGTAALFSFGDDVGQIAHYAWTWPEGNPRAVGLKLPNQFGLYDIHGNADEWCQDWYSLDSYARSSTVDPVGPATGSERVQRSSNMSGRPIGWTRSAARNHCDPLRTGQEHGFRVVRGATTPGGKPEFASSAPPHVPLNAEQARANRLTGTVQPIDPALRRAYKSLPGEWRIVGDELVQDSYFSECMLVFGDSKWKDYDFACEVKMTTRDKGGSVASRVLDSASDKVGREVGLLYRASGAGRNEFVLGGSGSSVDCVRGIEDGQFRELGRRKAALEYDHWYNVAVRVRGIHCQCFVDDQLVFECDEKRNPQGFVGFRTHALAARFRGIRVADPAGNVLFEGFPKLPATAEQWPPATSPASVRELMCLKGHGALVLDTAFSPDGRHVISASCGRIWGDKVGANAANVANISTASTLRLWDAATGRELDRSEINPSSWKLRRGQEFPWEPGRPRFITAFGEDLALLALKVRRWSVEAGKLKSEILFPESIDGNVSPSFSPDGNKIRALWLDGRICEWDLKDKVLVRNMPALFKPGDVVCQRVSPNGKFALLARRNAPFAEIDLDTGMETGRWTGLASVRCMAFSPDSTQVLSGENDGTVRLWDALNAKQVHLVGSHKLGVNSAAFSPDGRRALTGGDDQTVRLWDVANKKELACLTGHTGAILSVAFSPDGARAVSGSDDYTVRIWRLPPADSAPDIGKPRGGTEPAVAAVAPVARPPSGTAPYKWPAGTPAPAIAPFDAKQARANQEAWAKHLGVPVEQTNSIGMKLVLIPPGEFMMGTTPAESDRWAAALNEIGLKPHAVHAGEPQHHVTLSRSFLIAGAEVTVGEFAKFIAATGYITDAERHGGGESESTSEGDPKKKDLLWRSPGYETTADSPVTQVTWNDAVQFCNWLSAQEKFSPRYQHDATERWCLLAAGDGYRLPTEAEWEYVCRAGTTTHFYFGDNPAQFDRFSWLAGNSGGRARPVGTKLPNAFGVYDMHGNAWEWCNDVMGPYVTSEVVDPIGPPSGDLRAMRGGTFAGGPIYRTAHRFSSRSSRRFFGGGFRVVRTATKSPPVLASAAAPASAATTAGGIQAKPDPIGAKLAKAKDLYEHKLQSLRDGVLKALERREATARANGDKKLVDQIKAEREAFEAGGKLPTLVPTSDYQRQSSGARTQLEAAYSAAIKAYTKAAMDDRSTSVESERAKFLKESTP